MNEIIELIKNSDVPEVISFWLKFRIAAEIIVCILAIVVGITFFKEFFKK
ncbi:MAG: hypothetical protein IJ597_05340 [Synergistaceae bacterium]|nr:hypothetical protein [Synergistaceae bacterium]